MRGGETSVTLHLEVTGLFAANLHLPTPPTYQSAAQEWSNTVSATDLSPRQRPTEIRAAHKTGSPTTHPPTCQSISACSPSPADATATSPQFLASGCSCAHKRAAPASHPALPECP